MAAGLFAGSVGDCWASCFAAADAVVAVTAAGNLLDIVVDLGLVTVGDLTQVGDVGVCYFLEETGVGFHAVWVLTLCACG